MSHSKASFVIFFVQKSLKKDSYNILLGILCRYLIIILTQLKRTLNKEHCNVLDKINILKFREETGGIFVRILKFEFLLHLQYKIK